MVALGPGLGTAAETADFVAGAMEHGDEGLPLVIDADGINLLAAAPGIRQGWAGPVVLTPHPGEAARLLGVATGEVTGDRIGAAVELARAWEAVTVLKGAPTIVADPGRRVALCPLGNPGMASGGTGDVLTGVVAALIGQGLTPWTGAALGVYLHALAVIHGESSAHGRWSIRVTRKVASAPRPALSSGRDRLRCWGDESGDP